MQSQSASLLEKWSRVCTYYKAPKKEKPTAEHIMSQKPIANHNITGATNSNISNNNLKILDAGKEKPFSDISDKESSREHVN